MVLVVLVVVLAVCSVFGWHAGPRSVSRRRSALSMGVGNSFGRVFRISTFGESHGGGVGVIVDGCPPRLPLTTEDVQKELDRRKPGQSRLTTPRDEEDRVEILSGTYDGVTLGTPIGMIVRNKDQRSGDYDEMAAKYLPSHADATYDAKYGVRAVAGGGRSSARETIGRVAAGAVAKKILKLYSGVEIVGYVQKVQDVELTHVDHDTVRWVRLEKHPWAVETTYHPGTPTLPSRRPTVRSRWRPTSPAARTLPLRKRWVASTALAGVYADIPWLGSLPLWLVGSFPRPDDREDRRDPPHGQQHRWGRRGRGSQRAGGPGVTGFR